MEGGIGEPELVIFVFALVATARRIMGYYGHGGKYEEGGGFVVSKSSSKF